jgi:phosphomannomutase
VLSKLATRDALLPLVSVLVAAGERGVVALFEALPKRYSKAGLVRPVPVAVGRRVVAAFQSMAEPAEMLGRYFPAGDFGAVEAVDFTDGVRVRFAGGDIAHFRPSGNADEFRIYAVSDAAEGAARIVALATAEEGILRRMAGDFAAE